MLNTNDFQHNKLIIRICLVLLQYLSTFTRVITLYQCVIIKYLNDQRYPLFSILYIPTNPNVVRFYIICKIYGGVRANKLLISSLIFCFTFGIVETKLKYQFVITHAYIFIYSRYNIYFFMIFSLFDLCVVLGNIMYLWYKSTQTCKKVICDLRNSSIRNSN